MYKFISVCLFSLFLTLGLQAADSSADTALSAVEPESVTLAEEPGRIEVVAKKFGVTWPTLIAQMVNFLLVTFVLYKFAIKPILATYDERQKKIADGLQYAEEMKAQLLEAEKERLEKIKEAVAEAQKILGDARDQSKAMLEQKIQEAFQGAYQPKRLAVIIFKNHPMRRHLKPSQEEFQNKKKTEFIVD